MNHKWALQLLKQLRVRTEPATIEKAGIVRIGAGMNVDSTGTLSVTPFYGVQVDFSVSNPAAAITYTGAAAAMTQADRKAWAYSKVKPVVAKNGQIVYDLKRDNLALKADGVTPSNLDGTDGDVCAAFSPMWIKFTKQGKIMQINLSEYPQAGYISAHMFNAVNRPFIHLGMFEATGDKCNSVYSTTLTPAVNRSLKTFRQQAQTKNAGLNEQYYGVYTYLSDMLYLALYLMAYGNLNSQAAVGNGNVNTSAAIPVAKEELLTCSGEYGLTDVSNTHVMALYVVNPWGNVWKFREACMWSSGQFTMATDQADLYDIEQGFATRPETWYTFNTGNPANSYVTELSGDKYAGFFPCATSGGSSETYVCDYFYQASGDRVCLAGGRWDTAARAGAFCVTVDSAPAAATARLGARLQMMNVAATQTNT